MYVRILVFVAAVEHDTRGPDKEVTRSLNGDRLGVAECYF
jgi:hypothetical protein